MIGRILKAIGHWIGKHGNLILLILVIVQCFLSLNASFSCLNVKRQYEKQRIVNQMQIEKAETDKKVSILEAEKEAEVLRIKGGR